MLEREIFDAALDIDDPIERSRFIDQQCGSDDSMRDHLNGLMEAHQNLGNFLVSPPTLIDAIDDDDTIVANGSVKPTVDCYELIEQIGHGGMGVVYLAQQLRPVRRQVALKVIKPGMDSAEVVARFEAERQTLAMMDHPNIARVFDGGTTDQGYPYFAMELVQGLPITDHCEQHALDTDQRLELFRQVCRGVQHAHQKGIIHRDIKPSNIIVVQHDDGATIKVIDFGIAKAIQSEPAVNPFVTIQGQWIGTPAYMSPEQAGKGLDIDTRSDVYALGVVLYELLADRTPLEATRIQGMGYAELQRLIQQEPATKPSAIAYGAVPRPISSELDWIALRALEKDRSRRYQSVADLAADIDRYAANQPISACPPSLLYSARKFAKRNIVPLAAASVVLAALIIGSSISVWQAILATRAAEHAELEQSRAQQQFARAEQSRKLALANQIEAEKQRSRAEENLLESFAVANLIDNKLMDRPGSEALRVELLTATLDHFDQLFENADLNQDHLRQLASVYNRSASLRQALGARHRAILDQQKSLQIYERLLLESPDDPNLLASIAKTRIDIAYNHHAFHQTSEAIRLDQVEMARLEELVERFPDHRGLKYQLSRVYNNTGAGYSRLHRHDLAQQMLERALPIRIELAAGRPNGALAQLYNDIGFNQLNLGNFRAALAANREALDIRRQLFESRPSPNRYRGHVAASHNHIGDVFRAMNRHEDALREYGKAIGIEQELVAQNESRPVYKSRLANSYDNKAMVLHAMDLHGQALEAAQVSLDLFQSLIQVQSHWQADAADVLNSMAKYLLALSRIDEARESLDQAFELQASLQDQNTGDPAILNRILQDTYGVLGDVEIAAGAYDRAETAIKRRWELVADQPGYLHAVVLDFGKLAKAVVNSELEPVHAKRQHDRYVNLAFKALREALSPTATKMGVLVSESQVRTSTDSAKGFRTPQRD